MQSHTALVDCRCTYQRRACPITGQRKERLAGAEHFRDHIYFDLIQRAALHEGHLQPPPAEHPDIAVIESTQFLDQRIQVGAHFQRAFRLLDRPRRDDDDTVDVIGPGALLPGNEIIGRPPHDHSPYPLQEQAIIMLAEVRVVILVEPVERPVSRYDQAVQTGSYISANDRHSTLLDL
ncbi:Hypothetical protein AT6N2_L2003 [Agrobacterium tumefaciens]|nr:Hypothetical protein AT6N2_L2003 [Agrobacterium tumefaciens]